MGYLSLVVNIPLVIIAFIMLNRDFAIKSSIYVIVFSVSVIIIKELDISKLYYFTETGTSTVLAPIASGVIRGIIYAYISSYTCNHLRNKEHENIKYEIITKAPTKITSYINQQLHQKATIINAKGAFSDEDTSVILCIVEKSYAPFLEKFLLDFPNFITFKSYASDSISGITYK